MRSPFKSKYSNLAARLGSTITEITTIAEMTSITSITAILFCAVGARAGSSDEPSLAPGANPAEAPWMQPLLGTGFKTNDAYTDGNIFLTAPLWSTLGKNGTLGGDYLFLEPYTSLGAQRQVTTSLGLGWRHLFSDEPRSALQKQGVAGFLEEGWFIGGNVFGDMLDTDNHNSFWQLGVGGEIGTRYLEFDGNYYCPLTGEKLADRDVTTQNFTNTSTSAQTTYGDPFATGNSIMQPYTTQTTTTTTSGTTRTTTDLYEMGMRGWDLQAVALVPWVDQWVDLRANGGYFRLDNQPLGPQDGPTGPVHGWKAGAELRPVPAIVLGGEWYEDERFAGGNWIVSLEFQIPLDRDWMDAFKPRRRHLVEHLAEPVHRQNDAIKLGNSTSQHTAMVIAHKSSQTTTTNAEALLKSDIVFVNNGGAVGNGIQAGSASGNGMAQNPFSTIQAGANLAGTNSTSSGSIWTAYVQGGGPTYTEVVNTMGSTHYLGSSQTIAGLGGKVFGGGPNPVLNGAIVADATAFGAIKTVSVRGFTILNGDFADEIAPISITDVPNVKITKNIIQNSTQDGIDITVDNALGALASNVLIAGNTITYPSGVGISLAAYNGGASINATVKNNSISNPSSDGIDLLATGSAGTGGQIQAAITGNTVSLPSGYGISFQADNNGATITATASNNTITNAGIAGIQADTYAASAFTLTASNNTISNSFGVGFSLNSNDNSTINFTASGNQITGGTNGLSLSAFDSSTLTGSITANTISQSSGPGILAAAQDTSTFSISVNQNTLSNNGNAGIEFQQSNSAAFNVNVATTLFNNTVTGDTHWMTNTGTPAGSIILNGNTYTLPANAP